MVIALMVLVLSRCARGEKCGYCGKEFKSPKEATECACQTFPKSEIHLLSRTCDVSKSEMNPRKALARYVSGCNNNVLKRLQSARETQVAQWRSPSEAQRTNRPLRPSLWLAPDNLLRQSKRGKAASAKPAAAAAPLKLKRSFSTRIPKNKRTLMLAGWPTPGFSAPKNMLAGLPTPYARTSFLARIPKRKRAMVLAGLAGDHPLRQNGLVLVEGGKAKDKSRKRRCSAPARVCSGSSTSGSKRAKQRETQRERRPKRVNF